MSCSLLSQTSAYHGSSAARAFDMNRSGQRQLMSCQLISWNNQGVECFEGGDYMSAIKCFRRSLEEIKQFSEQLGQRPHHNNIVSGNSSQAMCHDILLDGISPSTTEQTRIYDSFPLHDTCLRMIPQAFSSLASAASIDNSASTLNTIMSSITIFNCALSFHLEGKRRRSGSFQYLERAMMLYNQALALTHMEYCEQEDDSTSDCFSSQITLLDFLQVAILNNMGLVLRYDFQKFSQSQLYFETLVTYANEFQPDAMAYNPYHNSLGSHNQEPRHSTSRRPAMDRVAQLVDEFLLNGVALHSSPCTPCAPAA